MYTELTRTIAPSAALELAQGLIENAAAAALADTAIECTCRDDWHGCSCPARDARSRIYREGILFHPDCHSGNNWVRFIAPNTVLLVGDAGAGRHTLTIHTASGLLVVTHDGRRRSFPGNALSLLPEIWWELNNINDWKLFSSQSSQPGWAVVCGFLSGKHGSGPENLEEAERLQEEADLADLRRRAEAAGRKIPELYRDFMSGRWCQMEDGAEWKPRWTGIEYRRAAANGVAL